MNRHSTFNSAPISSPLIGPYLPEGAGARNPSPYIWRVEECPDCDRATDIRCQTCWSSGEVEAACCNCTLVAPLNDDGECRRCADSADLPAAEFDLKYRGWALAEHSAYGMGGKL